MTDLMDRVARTANLAAQQMLKYGGEVFRAEEIVRRIGQTYGYDADVIALTTGITMTLTDRENGKSCSLIARVTSVSVDLNRVERVNALSRRLCSKQINLEEAENELLAIDRMKPMSRWCAIGFAGGSAGFFALMFGGGWFELMSAALCGALIKLLCSVLPDESGMPVTSVFSGFLTGILAHVMVCAASMGNVDCIIISTLMPFLPGLSFTNAIRDSMNGDLISGSARLGDAITRAVVMAGGVGAGLWIWMKLTGGVL